MKIGDLTISLKLKLLIEIVLSFILTLAYLIAFAWYFLVPNFTKNEINPNVLFREFLLTIYFISAIGVFILCFFINVQQTYKIY